MFEQKVHFKLLEFFKEFCEENSLAMFLIIISKILEKVFAPHALKCEKKLINSDVSALSVTNG